MIDFIALKSILKKADKINNLKEKYDFVAGNSPRLVDSFESFYEAYKIDSETQGYPVSARNLAKQALNTEDKETLKDWFTVSQSLETLEDKGIIKPKDLESMSFKGALAILEQAWENLTQNDTEEECQNQRHA